MDVMIQIAIVHYNTPELTEAGILSLRKHGGAAWPVTIFDNSDRKPFKKKMKGVKVIDNTKGQVIDFDKFLADYPDRNIQLGAASNDGSVKHILSVQKLWELLPQGFILMESDILIRKDISFLWNERYAACGKVRWFKVEPKPEQSRLLPFLCYMNVPLLTANGARYFDPERCWNLWPNMNDPRNHWDTGACLLDDIIHTKPQLVARLYPDLDQYYVHYNGGSWRQNDDERRQAWLDQHRQLWEPDRKVDSKDVALCAIVRCENKYLPEWVEHHMKLGVKKIYIYDNSHDGDEQPADVLGKYVESGKVEIIDYRNIFGDFNVQDRAYNDFYKHHGWDYGWIGFFDIDELIVTEGRTKLPTLLNKMQADVVVLSWRMMTDSGLVHYDKKPVLKRFTQPAKMPRYENGTEFVKSFVRGGIAGLTFESQPHCPSKPSILKVVNTKGEAVNQYPAIRPTYEVAWVNHYHTKTAEEFIEKVRRGFPNGTGYTANYVKNAIDYFFSINERTAEKEAILSAVNPQP